MTPHNPSTLLLIHILEVYSNFSSSLTSHKNPFTIAENGLLPNAFVKTSAKFHPLFVFKGLTIPDAVASLAKWYEITTCVFP